MRNPNLFKIKMLQQHLQMMKGDVHEIDMGIAYELIKRGVAEVDPLDAGRFKEFEASIASEDIPDAVIIEREKRLKAYHERCEKENVRPMARVQLGI